MPPVLAHLVTNNTLVKKRLAAPPSVCHKASLQQGKEAITPLRNGENVVGLKGDGLGGGTGPKA